MSHTKKYRYVQDIRDEGLTFTLVSRYIAHFYLDIMNGRARNDGPRTLMKYSRDWEYPWVLLQSAIRPGQKVLDCGAGYSPLMFIWSSLGAKVHAIDRGALICSRGYYALWCVAHVVGSALKLPFRIARAAKGKHGVAWQMLRDYVGNWGIQIGRIGKSDFWGPIPPSMLKQYGITYRNGPTADFTKLPYARETFDVVTCVSVLEHVPEEVQLQGIREMARVLKKGGKLIITYDRVVDRTDAFIAAAKLKPITLDHFAKPRDGYDPRKPDVIGMCLTK